MAKFLKMTEEGGGGGDGGGVSVLHLYNSTQCLFQLKNALTITSAKLLYSVKYLSWPEYMHEVTLIPI